MFSQPCLPAIVVPAFRRRESLRRLLMAIGEADYEGYDNIPLVVSIDKSDSVDISDVAKEFTWRHGHKRIITHKVHMGLRKHIIACGNLSEEYGAVIILEDDLQVSPVFYNFAVQALKYYYDDNRISGVSLYSYDFNEYARIAFWPIDDGYDNYFIQAASSWGQLWSWKQWRQFKEWYAANACAGVNPEDPLPDTVIHWPESSWKKYFNKYMVLTNKYFIYPRLSLSTNFGDIGTHRRLGSVNCQVPLALKKTEYDFSSFEESVAVYDSFFEIQSKCLQHYNHELSHIDFECDFYGTKALYKVTAEHLLSIRECMRPIISYSMDYIPHELNVVFSAQGDFFHLAKVRDFGNLDLKKHLLQLRHLHKNLGLKRYGLLFLMNLVERFVLQP